MRVSLPELRQTTFRALARQGYPPAEAEIILDVLLYAQLRGNNQGIVKLIGAGMPHSADAGPITIVRETPVSALLDGAQNAGMVVLRAALDLALEKAEAHGFGLVGTHHTNTSTGAIGYYASIGAKAGCITFVFAGSGEYVAMHGSYQPMLGTNPLAVGIPSAGEPVVFDMATSAIARFGIVEAQAAGRPIPPDVALGPDGQPTTDAATALKGAIRTFGGYKGAALALIVELLTGPLVETTRTPDGRKTDWGNLVLAFHPSLLTDAGDFAARVGTITANVKGARRLPDVDEILIPGERGNRLMARALADDALEIDDALWSALQRAAD